MHSIVRHRYIWFLISLLLGPIATFLIVVMGPPEADGTTPRDKD